MAFEIGETLIGLGGGYLHTSFRGSPANLDLVSLTGYQYAGEKQAIMGYYNSGFLSGLGGVLKSVGPYIAAAGSIAAEVLPAIYHTGTSGATQSPAAGPTAAPVMAKPSMKSTSLVSRTPIQKIEQVLDPTQLGGPVIGTVSHGRYGTPGEKGFHMIKRGPHAGMWTRNRHRNVANIHALRRSLSRIHGFEKICRKVVHFVHPRKATGHAVFKKRRRS